MLRHALVLLALAALAHSDTRQHYDDPFTAIDKHLSQSLAYHYLWPWNQLIRAAAALDAEEALEEPKIHSDTNKFQVTMNVKRFQPEDLKVKVKNRYISIEGKHRVNAADQHFLANHFMQRFALPASSKPEEVKAELRENGILVVWAPKYKLPPPPPEREVPIEILAPATTVQPEPTTVEPTTTKKEEVPQTAAPAVEQEAEAAEATTHIGKSRKKELKTTLRPQRDNEVGKLDGNALDYALVDE